MMNTKIALKSDFDLVTRSSNVLKTSHLSPLSTYLVLYLFLSAQVFPRTSGGKFYPNGRYGRRSDLPPILSPPLIKAPSMGSSMDSFLLSQDSLQNSLLNVNPAEEYVPMWCSEIDRKLNLFKCFDRFPMKILRAPQDKLVELTKAKDQGTDQDQQS